MLGKTIGEGEFGVVKEATNEVTDEKVAVKILRKNKDKQSKIENMKREIAIMRKLKHQNIV